MFGRFFTAIRRLTEAAEGLAASLAEANERFRANILDTPEQSALPAPVAEESPPRNGKRVKAAV